MSLSLDAVNGRLDDMQQRLGRIETGLNSLLKVFGLAALQPEEQNRELGSNAVMASRKESLNVFPAAEDDGDDDNGLGNLFSTDVTTGSGPSTDGSHHYAPLDTTKSEIRVLALHQSDDPSNPVVAELHVHSLDEEPYNNTSFKPYQALSYTWGAPVFDGSLQLNGFTFPVTDSLEAALRAIRNRKDPMFGNANSKMPTYWWIDQICINQTNVDERNEQVALMRRIYKRASSVQVWLGEEADDSSTAMDLLTTLGATPVRMPGEKALEYPLFTEEEVQRHWRALDALFKRPWWERVWIRQEIALSNVIVLVCGSKSCYMDAIGPALVALQYVHGLGYETPFERTSNTDARVSLPWTYHAEQLVQLHRRTNGGYTWVELQQLLPGARACKATDARDTVFSVLGLADPEVYPVIANYRQELKDVLMSATRAVITKEHGLDILGSCQNPEKSHNLPSWVPNLSEPWKAMPFKSWNGEHGSHMVELLVTDRDTGIVQIEGECLILRGGHIDAVAILCTDVVPDDASSDKLDVVYACWQKFLSNAAKSKELNESDGYEFADADDQKSRMNWIRFLSILQDEARDMKTYSYSAPKRKKNKRAGDTKIATLDEILQTADEELQGTHSYHHLNLKLSRSYLLPSQPSTFTVSLHPNRRIHAGLRRNGVGRRLCITKRGFLALVPADAEVQDSIALFQGASFPYVLRKYGGKKRHVLVGEAFVPRYASGDGERMAKEEFRVGMDALIRLY